VTDFGRRPDVPIKSIQSGTITIPPGSLSNTATINPVDTTRSLLLSLGYKSNSTSATRCLARLELTNSTTITAARHGTPSTVTISFIIIEFISGIKSNQHGEISVDDVASNTATINAVDTTKALVSHLAQSCDQIGVDRGLSTLTLTNSTTLTAEKLDTVGLAIVSFQVLEFR